MSSLTVPIPPDLRPACRAGNTDLGTVPYRHEGEWKLGYYDPKSKVFVAKTPEGNVATVMINVNRSYIDGLIKRSRWGMVDVQVTYDEAANAAYIYLDSGLSRAKVARMYACDPVEAGMINIDFGADGRIIGVEVLAANVKLPQSLLDGAERIGIDGT